MNQYTVMFENFYCTHIFTARTKEAFGSKRIRDALTWSNESSAQLIADNYAGSKVVELTIEQLREAN